MLTINSIDYLTTKHFRTVSAHLGFSEALRFRHLIGEVSLLKACGTHALVCGWVWAWRRVWRVQARLDQSFARLTGNHGLKLARGERVHVARFTRHQEQHLRAC